MDQKVLVLSAEHEQALVDECPNQRLQWFKVDLTGVTDRDELIAVFYSSIDAPTGARLNWDALTDVLHGDLLERIASVNHDGIVIRIIEGDCLLHLDKDTGDTFLRILARMCSYYRVYDLSCFIWIIAREEHVGAISGRIPSTSEEERVYRRIRQEGESAKARLRIE